MFNPVLTFVNSIPAGPLSGLFLSPRSVIDSGLIVRERPHVALEGPRVPALLLERVVDLVSV